MTFELGPKQPTGYKNKDDKVSYLNIDALVPYHPVSCRMLAGCFSPSKKAK
jgi:hypothetical protein